MRHRYRLIATLLTALALLWLLDRTLAIDPLRAGAGALLLYVGYRLLRSGADLRLVGTVHLDLTRTILPPGEQTIRIRALAGDVDLFLPYDLPVSITAAVGVGKLHLMGAGRRRASYTSPGYADAVQKVKIDVALAVGEIDVRCL